MNPTSGDAPLGSESSVDNRSQLNTQTPMPAEPRKQPRLDRLRNLMYNALDNRLFATATFIGEKLIVMTDKLDDIYFVALSFYQRQQYQRALQILNNKGTFNISVRCRYLAALCSNAQHALAYLGETNPFTDAENDLVKEETMDGCIKLESVMCFARGKAYFVLQNFEKARECYQEALSVDVKCYGAWDALIKNNMMDEKAELEFFMTSPFDQCDVDEYFFKHLYSLKLKKNNFDGTNMKANLENIENSLDEQLSIAQGYLDACKYEDCLKICEEIKSQDALFKEPIQLFVSCIYKLGMNIELYEYALELVKKMSDEVVTWYAAGLHNLYIKENLEARKDFGYALTISPFFQQSWLEYGHTFSVVKDHDQAIQAYETCKKLIPGSYLPLMNIAMEYMEQNQMDVAFKYFTRSPDMSDQDPFLSNEWAVYCYKTEEYQEARRHLHTALKLAKNRQSKHSPIWEKIWCNLGHVYRHPPCQNYDRVLKCFENALERNPKNSDALATIGMIYQLQGNTAKAIAQYLKALDNTDDGELITELLNSAILKNVMTPYAAGTRHPSSNDGFDIFQMAGSIPDKRGKVERELDDDYWKRSASAAGDSAGSNAADQGSLVTNDSMIIDEGDMSRLWI